MTSTRTGETKSLVSHKTLKQGKSPDMDAQRESIVMIKWWKEQINDFDDDSAGSEVVDRSFVGGDEDEAAHIQNLMTQFGVSQEDAQQMYEFLLQDDVQNEAQAMESRGPLNYDEANVVLLHQNGFITKDQFDEYMADVIANTSFSDRRILNNMSRFGLTREQAVEFEEERQGQNDEIERIKTDYDLDDFDAELMFMYERQIISYEEFEEKKAAHQRPRLQPITVSTKTSQDNYTNSSLMKTHKKQKNRDSPMIPIH